MPKRESERVFDGPVHDFKVAALFFCLKIQFLLMLIWIMNLRNAYLKVSKGSDPLGIGPNLQLWFQRIRHSNTSLPNPQPLLWRFNQTVYLSNLPIPVYVVRKQFTGVFQ